MTDVVQMLRTLVGFDTVSARSNRPLVEWLKGQLEPLGFSVELLPYVDPAGIEKVNMVARIGEGEGGLALVGHTDTVPYDAAWSDALSLTERDGRLYGRGSADTKAFLAAALAAVQSLPKLQRPLYIIGTADEEIGCVGAKRLGQQTAARPQHAIVGEPTELIPIRAHKGYFAAEVEVIGQEGHSAYPHLGRNAILDAARLLNRLRDALYVLQEDSRPEFDPPWTTWNVGLIEGGKARNVIAGSCRFPIEWRPLPGQDGERVPAIIQDVLQALGITARLEVVRRDAGAATPADAPIVKFLEEATGQASRTIPFGTELPHLNALGAQSCVCGPGDIRVAHRSGEFVPRAELEAAVGIYRQAVAHFCS